MGIFDFFRRTIDAHEILTEAESNEFLFAGPLFSRLAEDVDNMSEGDLWEAQPHLRTVTTFIAEQISSVGIHVFRRDGNDGRVRVRSDDSDLGAARLAEVMKKANDQQLMQELLEASILDFLLYDEFIWLVVPEQNIVQRVMPKRVMKMHWESDVKLKAIDVADNAGRVVRIPAEQIIRVHGYSPLTNRYGSSPVHALRSTLKEQLESASYRAQLWKSGARIGGVITRPANAGWDDKARKRFQAAWRSQYTGRGSQAGGTPILEDGMTYQPHHLNAKDEMIVEMTTLSLKTVAQVYHVNPTMVGVLEATNYSNVKEFRKSLFGDSLGPLINRLEGVINEFLAPMLDVPEGVYAEFNIEQKLRGSFEEQGAIMYQATGAPWMTVNESRARMNLPAIEGGDVLARPMNTAFGDDPAPEPEENPADDGGGEE